MVDNAFFIVGWLLVLVLSLDRRFLLTLRRSVCALPITSFALAVWRIRYSSSQTLPYWGTLQGRPVAFSLNPLLLKLALQQSEIRTISPQQLGSSIGLLVVIQNILTSLFNTWPIPGCQVAPSLNH